MKFSIKDFFSKCDQIRTDLQYFTEEIINEKPQFLCSVAWNTLHKLFVKRNETFMIFDYKIKYE